MTDNVKLNDRIIEKLLDQIDVLKAENQELASSASPCMMSTPCCVGVARAADNLTGTEESIGDLPIYSNSADGSKVGVVVIHDIFGFGLPNCKYVVDHLSKNGFSAVMPDFYRGKPWPANEFEILDPLDGDKFGSWFGSIMTPAFWGQFNKDIDAAVSKLKTMGCTKFYVMGFCWGGKAAVVAAKSGAFSGAISLHGAAHSAEDVTEAKCPTFFITVPDDAYYPEAMHKIHRDLGAEVKVFDGMYHGFVVRGDFQNDAKVREASQTALSDCITFFKK